jgi:hypothetical protein
MDQLLTIRQVAEHLKSADNITPKHAAAWHGVRVARFFGRAGSSISLPSALKGG